LPAIAVGQRHMYRLIGRHRQQAGSYKGNVFCQNAGIKKGPSKEPLGRSPPPGWGVRGKSLRNQFVVSECVPCVSRRREVR